MSNIILNVENFKRSSKRLQKALKDNGFDINLSKSQDIMAKAFGVKNSFEMLNLLEIERKETVISFEDDFIKQLNNIISLSNTIKKSYIYTDYGNFIIDIVSHNNEAFGIYFGATSKPTINDFIVIGIDKETAIQLVNLVLNIPDDKYEGLLFGSNIFKKYCKKSNVYYFKNELFDNEKEINGHIYSKRYTIFSQNKFNDLLDGLDKDLNLIRLKSNRYPGYEDIDVAFKMMKSKDQVLVEYFNQSNLFDKTVPNCYISKIWELDNNNKVIEKKI